MLKILFSFFILLSSTVSHAITVCDLEKSLNEITTYQAEFLQLNADGSQSKGVFYLSRPHHLKFEYTVPENSSILAKNGWLTFYDAAQEEEATLEIDKTPAQFLLNEKISLTKNVKLKALYTQNETITVILTDPEETFTLSLYFNEKNNLLQGWQVKDVQNNITTVEFLNPVVNQPIPETIFLRGKKFKSRRDQV